MTVENVTYISDLDQNNPAGGDSISEGDDHIRNIKKAIKGTFPNVTDAVTVTSEELNQLPQIIDSVGSGSGLASCKYNGTEVKYGYNVDRVEKIADGAYRIYFISPINADGNLTSGDYAGLLTPYTTNGRPVIGWITDQRESYVDVGFRDLDGNGDWVNPSSQGFAFILIDQVPG